MYQRAPERRGGCHPNTQHHRPGYGRRSCNQLYLRHSAEADGFPGNPPAVSAGFLYPNGRTERRYGKMRTVFAAVKRLLASNKISFILTVLVVLCATSSGDVVLSSGNYTWLPDQLWLSGILHFPCQHSHPPVDRPPLFCADRDQSDGRVQMDRKRDDHCRITANVLFTACYDFSSRAVIHADTLVRMAD